jgi:hypothetical protein
MNLQYKFKVVSFFSLVKVYTNLEFGITVELSLVEAYDGKKSVQFTVQF